MDDCVVFLLFAFCFIQFLCCNMFSKRFDVRNRYLWLFLVPRTVIREAWCLHFGILGSYFGILGAPWATSGAAGRTRWDPGSHVYRFWHDFGTPLWQLFGHRGLEIWCCFRVRFHVPSDTDFWFEIRTLGLLKRGFCEEGIAKTNFSKKSDFWCLFVPWSQPWNLMATGCGPEFKAGGKWVVLTCFFGSH